MTQDTQNESDGVYGCYGECGTVFDSLDDMNYVVGAEGRDGRHFCDECAARVLFSIQNGDEVSP